MTIATDQHIHCWIIDADNTGTCDCGETKTFSNRSSHAESAAKSRQNGQARRDAGDGVYKDGRTGRWAAYRTLEGGVKKRYYGFSHPTREAAIEARRVAMESEE